MLDDNKTASFARRYVMQALPPLRGKNIDGLFYKETTVYQNASVSIYVPVMATNDEGDPIETWGYKKTPTPDDPAETIRADVQPRKLTESECVAWGITDKNANSKLVFFSTSVYIALNNRMYVVSDFPGEAARYYDIKGVNRWPRHGEAVIVPVQGE